MKINDQASYNTLWHYLVLIAQCKVALVGPSVHRTTGAEQLRSDPRVRAGHWVTQPKLHHQGQQFIAHRRESHFMPDPPQISHGENTQGVRDLTVVQHAIDCRSAPFRLEHDGSA